MSPSSWKYPPPLLGNGTSEERRLVLRVLSAGLKAADPERLTSTHLSSSKGKLLAEGFDLGKDPFVISVGKASAGMAWAAFNAGARRGLVVTPRGYQSWAIPFRHLEANHPTPDDSSIRAGQEVTNAVETEDNILMLLSGGASSLMELPEDGLGLEDLAWVYQTLTSQGTTIGTLNEVRKHLSSLKGGKLAAHCRGKLVTLVLSDVPGDRLADVASSPTIPARTDFDWLRRTLEGFGELPSGLRRFLGAGKESPASARPTFLVGGNRTAVAGAVRAAAELGFPAKTARLAGEASAAGRRIAKKRFEGFLVLGGETTVEFKGAAVGIGGRNQELALASSILLERGAAVGALATDGVDGPTPYAGALVAELELTEQEALDCLKMHDSSSCLERENALLTTGPTGTNVSDLVVAFKRSWAGASLS
ncbi:MAG: glycerate kinase type-2 family protein [Thermoprotei archaeon]